MTGSKTTMKKLLISVTIVFIGAVVFVGYTDLRLRSDCTLSRIRDVVKSPLRQGKQGSGVWGCVISWNDAGGEPDLPLQSIVLTIPQDRFEALLDEVGGGVLSPGLFNRLDLSVSEELFKSYVGAYIHTRDNGAYDLHVPAGDHMLCIANLKRPVEKSIYPMHIAGCLEITIPENKQMTQDIYWSIWGVTP